MDRSEDVCKKMAGIGVRIFAVRLGRECEYWVHPNKTTPQWRKDVREFLKTQNKGTSEEGYAHDDVSNRLNSFLTKKGYHEVADVVCDVYEGRISIDSAKIVDDPDHEEQADGFGHFGWESKAR